MSAAPITIAKTRPFTTMEAVRQTFLRWYILIPVVLAGSAGTYLLKKRVEPAYNSTATVRLMPATVRPQVETGVQLPREDAPDPRTLADSLQELVLETGEVLKLLRSKPDLFPDVDNLGEGFIRWMRSRARIQYKGGNIYSLEAWGRDPEQAMALARWMAASTMDGYKKILRQKAETLAKFTKEQSDLAQKALTQHEEAMIAFLRINPGLLVTAMDRDRRLSATGPDRMRVKSMLQRAGTALTSKDPALRALLEERERVQAELKGLKGDDAPASAGTAKLKELQAAKKRLEDLKAGGRSDADPTVKIAQGQVDRLEAEIKALKPGEAGAASQAEAKSKTRLKEIEKKLKVALKKQPQSSPRLEAQWGEMLRKQTLLVKHFEGFNRLASLAAFDNGLGMFETKDLAALTSDASEPTSPKGIKPWMILAVGVLFSGLLGLGLAIAFGRLDRKIYNTEELKQLVSLPLLAELPSQRSRDALRTSDEERLQSDGMISWSKTEEMLEVGIRLEGDKADGPARVISDGGRIGQMTMLGDGGRGGRLALPSHEQALQPVGTSMVLNLLEEPTTNMRVHSVVAAPPIAPGQFLVTAPRSSGADQVRLLAGRLVDEKGAPHQVVLIAGWEPRCGRTTVAANLALALAEARRRVLLVDACGGDRSLTRLMGLRPDDSTALYGQLSARMTGAQNAWTVYRLAESLSMIPASAATTPMGPMLSAVAFADLIEHCRSIFDVVVLDSRPLAEVSDAAILSQKSDAVITVVRRRATKLPGLQQLADQIGSRRIIGTVFNQH